MTTTTQSRDDSRAPEPPRVDPSLAKRKRVSRALALWVGVTLSGMTIVTALAIWHLVRRGRRLRDRLGAPRDVEWPDLPPPNNPGQPSNGLES